jgi:hypothetical protein
LSAIQRELDTIGGPGTLESDPCSCTAVVHRLAQDLLAPSSSSPSSSSSYGASVMRQQQKSVMREGVRMASLLASIFYILRSRDGGAEPILQAMGREAVQVCCNLWIPAVLCM